MKRTITIYILLHCTMFCFAQSGVEFQELKKAIENKSEYDERKNSRLRDLYDDYFRSRSDKPEEQFPILQALANEYETYVYDSAFHYTRKLLHAARLLKDPVKLAYAKNQLGLVLLSSGMFK